ncbi:MAG: hypothetical protein LBT09_03505 [Planctomycetaceae bacterium]|nr:hypothetical protein [Planctomycetaceae bacterium]
MSMKNIASRRDEMWVNKHQSLISPILHPYGMPLILLRWFLPTYRP